MRIKIVDTLEGEGGSKLERWWLTQGFQDIYKEFRKGKIEPSLLNKIKDIRKVEDVFHLKGYQFGNWVTNEDRYNYLAATAICLHDMNKVLKFKNYNLGLDKTLGVAFGARGQKGAIAHYEPRTNIINITRYKDVDAFEGDPSKAVRFVYSGGAGAFAHEYGHFLDYFFGARIETHSRIYALTNGRSTDGTKIDYDKNKFPMRHTTELILEKAYWKSEGKHSTYATRIADTVPQQYLEYFLRRNEIFARLFEQYIGYKLKALNIQNSFLTQTKYHTTQYMRPSELEAVIPLFDQLISQMRKHF